jgi:integrase
MTRLPGPPGSEEFMTKLRALNGTLPTGSLPGTLAALIDAYRASPEYLDLAPGSKRQYGKALSHLKGLGGAPITAITPQRLYELRDQLKTRYSRSAANAVLKLLRILFDWGSKRDFCDANPAAKVDKVRRPKDAKVVNRRWRDDELETVLELAPPWLRVAIAIAAYTGMRESDVARVTWKKYNGCEFETRQVKTGDPIWVAAHYRLREILDAAPRVSPQIVVGVKGRPMSANTLGSRFFDFLQNFARGRGRAGPQLPRAASHARHPPRRFGARPADDTDGRTLFPDRPPAPSGDCGDRADRGTGSERKWKIFWKTG